jgi:hypothetical protein
MTHASESGIAESFSFRPLVGVSGGDWSMDFPHLLPLVGVELETNARGWGVWSCGSTDWKMWCVESVREDSCVYEGGLQWHFLQLRGVSPIFFLSGLRFELEAILHEELKCTIWVHLFDLMPLRPRLR